MWDWLLPKSLVDKLDAIRGGLIVTHFLLNELEKKVVTQTEAMQVLEQEVAQMTDVVQSAVTTLTRLSEMIRAYVGEPDKLKALADQLDGSANALAAAIASSPPQPEPTPVDPQ